MKLIEDIQIAEIIRIITERFIAEKWLPQDFLSIIFAKHQYWRLTATCSQPFCFQTVTRFLFFFVKKTRMKYLFFTLTQTVRKLSRKYCTEWRKHFRPRFLFRIDAADEWVSATTSLLEKLFKAKFENQILGNLNNINIVR